MLEAVLLVATIALAFAFAWAALVKIARFPAWREALGGYGLPAPAESVASVAVPVAELAVAGTLLFGAARVGAAMTIFLLSAFSLAVLRARALEGDQVPCGCFGDTKARDYRVMITRNVLLGVLAAAVLLLGAEGESAHWAVTGAEILPAALACAGVVACLAVVRSVSASLDRGRDR